MHGADRGERTLALLNELEARYGPRAPKAALRIADRLHETFVRMAYHEMVRISGKAKEHEDVVAALQLGADDFVRKLLGLDDRGLGPKIRRCVSLTQLERVRAGVRSHRQASRPNSLPSPLAAPNAQYSRWFRPTTVDRRTGVSARIRSLSAHILRDC